MNYELSPADESSPRVGDLPSLNVMTAWFSCNPFGKRLVEKTLIYGSNEEEGESPNAYISKSNQSFSSYL